MDKLLAVLNDMHPEIDFEKEDNLMDGGIIDSFDIMRLILEIVDEYDVALNASDIIPANFNSANALYNLILSKRK